MKALKLFDRAGAVDLHCPLLDAIRIYLAGRQSRKLRTLGKDLIEEFSAPEYGWDPNAIRVGIAACVRAAIAKLLIGKTPRTNPADPELQKALLDSRYFNRAEPILEESEIDPDTLTEVRGILIRLTGNRRIDETPAALHDAAEGFGKDLLSGATRVELWAAPAGFPLPPAFKEGQEAFEDVLALTNPIHRVGVISEKRDALETGAKAIEELANYQEKWGAAFAEMRGLAAQLHGIEHQLPRDGKLRGFLREYRAALADAKVSDAHVWKTLLSIKASAALELESVLEDWKREAKEPAHAAISRLPEDLKGLGLPAELAKELGAPIQRFIDSIETETDPARVAALPIRARSTIDDVAEAIQRELDKRAETEGGETSPKSTKEIRRVVVADISMLRRVRNVEEWDALRDLLDARVRKLLEQGHEVEIG